MLLAGVTGELDTHVSGQQGEAGEMRVLPPQSIVIKK